MQLTPSTLTVNLTTQDVVMSDAIPIRANCTVTLTGTALVASSNIRLAVYRKGTLVATCSTFTGPVNAFVGILNLNTEEIVAVFEDLRNFVRRKMDLFIYDNTGTVFLFDGNFIVQNEPLRDTTALPSAVTPITSETGTWGNVKLYNGALYIRNPDDGLYYPLEKLAGTGSQLHNVLDPADGVVL